MGCLSSSVRPLLGGVLSYSLLKIVSRAGREDLIPVADVEQYADQLPKNQKDQFDQLLTNLESKRPALSFGGDKQILIQGILNVTPDSFSDGGNFAAPERALNQAAAMIEAGADIIDIGGESTRPGAAPVTIEEEINRIGPIVEGLKGKGFILSIDSRNAPVMAHALTHGAHIINDVSALEHDPDSLSLVATSNVPVIMMHALSDPRTMQAAPTYDNVVLDVYDYLEGRIKACTDAGIDRGNIIIDPGIGFGKTVDHNLALLKNISLFHGLGVRLLIGVSRKSFIGKIAGAEQATDRLPGSLAAAEIALEQGVQIIRVHDVAETAQFIRLRTAILCA